MTAATATNAALPAALPGLSVARPRPEPPGSLTASAVFGWRALLKIKHVPEQLFDVIAIPVVFTLMFTYLFGGALAGSTTRYLQFLLPGTLVMAMLLVTMYAGIGISADRSKGLSDRFRSLPLWRPAPIVGALLSDIARYLLAASLVVILGVAIGFRPAGGAPGVAAGIGVLLVFSLSLSWVWTTIGLLVRSPQAVIGGHPAAGQIAWVLLASAVLVAVVAPATVRLYAKETLTRILQPARNLADMAAE